MTMFPLIFDQGCVLRFPCFFLPPPDKSDFIEPFKVVLRDGTQLSECPLPLHPGSQAWIFRPAERHVAVAILGSVGNKFCKHVIPSFVVRCPHDAQPIQLPDKFTVQKPHPFSPSNFIEPRRNHPILCRLPRHATMSMLVLECRQGGNHRIPIPATDCPVA